MKRAPTVNLNNLTARQYGDICKLEDHLNFLAVTSKPKAPRKIVEGAYRLCGLVTAALQELLSEPAPRRRKR